MEIASIVSEIIHRREKNKLYNGFQCGDFPYEFGSLISFLQIIVLGSAHSGASHSLRANGPFVFPIRAFPLD